MKLDELPLPEPLTIRDEDGLLRYGFTTKQMRAAMRAGALAALDEAIKECEAGLRGCADRIRRLRDTIMEGK